MRKFSGLEVFAQLWWGFAVCEAPGGWEEGNASEDDGVISERPSREMKSITPCLALCARAGLGSEIRDDIMPCHKPGKIDRRIHSPQIIDSPEINKTQG
jgi:hypothetical protein